MSKLSGTCEHGGEKMTIKILAIIPVNFYELIRHPSFKDILSKAKQTGTRIRDTSGFPHVLGIKEKEIWAQR